MSQRAHLPRCLFVLLALLDAITGMDVTADGSYILATTPHYLLVIPTAIQGQAKSGFAQSITAKADAPIKLQVSPDDMVHYNISSLNFTPAHFNTGDAQEEFISTSTGNYIITWDFKKIKQGKRFHYKVRKKKAAADSKAAAIDSSSSERSGQVCSGH